MKPSQWWRDSRIRRRLVLGFYGALLFAVAAVVVGLVVTVMASRSANLSDRLAETADWLAGGTLALAAIAGLVALQAYASATGLPELDLYYGVDGRPGLEIPRFPRVEIPVDEHAQHYPRQVNGPFTFIFHIRNHSDYSARNPSIVMRLTGIHLAAGSPAIGDGWTIVEDRPDNIRAAQWDGGPTYSIHGHASRMLRMEVGSLIFEAAERFVTFDLLAEGYRRVVPSQFISIEAARSRL